MTGMSCRHWRGAVWTIWVVAALLLLDVVNTKKAGIGENWTPRELRHSFVSIMSDNGVPLETIADLVGHASTAVTEEVYRHQLKPVITRGAETMNTIFKQNQAKSA